ncbi:MAG: PadR family transcriptional regulator [Sciscionella sp.]|nr:PadR family transcriptional regulator [Sciscionella sp.]
MSLRMATLGLIAQHPDSTGYDLLKLFQRSLANVWPATQSQLYGELNKLSADGLIEVSATGVRGRKEYRATDAGHAAVRAWLESPNTEPRRNSFLLRIFMLSELSRPEIRRYLAEAKRASATERERLDDLDRQIDWDPDDDRDVLGRIVLDWGRRVCAMQLEWLDWATTQLPTEHREPEHPKH